tara:strand:+ start:224 stop:1354 length:1131 start_codon:yes stop_codon:yes gene_type:complete
MKQNRPHMPKWFTPRYARFFRRNFNKEEFDSWMETKEGMIQEALANGINPKDVSHFWYKGKNYSIFAKKNKEDFTKLTEALIESIKDEAPVFKEIKRTNNKDKFLFCISPTDAHFGKLSRAYETGEEYNLEIAKNNFFIGINGLLDYAKNYPIEKIIIVGGNDVLHSDMFNKTTKGTPQDTDKMWYDSFNMAFSCYISAINKLLEIADVMYVHCMSNHDYYSGWFFSKSLEAYYQGHKNVHFNCSPAHRKYVHYANNLLGFSHADGAKDNVLVDLMKQEAKLAWSNSKFGYWYLGHFHHHIRKQQNKTIGKDYGDVTIIRGNSKQMKDKVEVQYLRSISAADSYHHKYGYYSSRAMEAFIHHPIEGQIARFTKYIT